MPRPGNIPHGTSGITSRYSHDPPALAATFARVAARCPSNALRLPDLAGNGLRLLRTHSAVLAGSRLIEERFTRLPYDLIRIARLALAMPSRQS